jgi:hypothetical protein
MWLIPKHAMLREPKVRWEGVTYFQRGQDEINSTLELPYGLTSLKIIFKVSPGMEGLAILFDFLTSLKI